jgi:BlaI family transcriptional regulator, penicillinase repressor
MRHLHQMTDLQLEIMNVIWARGEATVAQVQAAIEPRHRLARKTVGTLLSRLDAQGVLAHREEGREYVYRPAVARADVERATIGNVLKRLFRGDVAAMVSHALEADDVRPGDVERLRRLLDEHADEGEVA